MDDDGRSGSSLVDSTRLDFLTTHASGIAACVERHITVQVIDYFGEEYGCYSCGREAPLPAVCGGCIRRKTPVQS
ncbi:hypothetical protein HZH66_014734 [Vespula vulgaris]|uniref:Uncharacterized protein n=1 Tax=Vespula vulgaris TaxID=7454 RepID=A0A834IYQ9_VESVU|nr:hypothetical protein HZH66_014734 [Vespula vulgaris]